MTNQLLRFGFHGFLNALPLLNTLQRSGAGFEMIVDAPCVIAEKLLSGQLDLAMIPSVEYLKVAHSYKLWPEMCIASKGEVLTVLLICKQPLSEVRSVAVDSRSRTSVALMKILFADRFHPEVRYEPCAPDIVPMLVRHGAALVIGDQALKYVRAEGMTVYDLSREWYLLTGKPFVHALVAVRPGVILTDEVKAAVRRAGRDVPQEIAKIVKTQAEYYAEGRCEDYLRNRIRYSLGEEELKGLICFRDKCHDRGLLAQNHDLSCI